MAKIGEMPLEDRPYEKLEKRGAEFLSDSELLAIIIKTGIPGQTSVQLAQKLIMENSNGDNLNFIRKMSIEELIAAINGGSFAMRYTGIYETNANRLTKSKGVVYYENHKETYYSERVLPGGSLNIPGRHAADDGTIRDGDGYICVAANSSYLSRGAIVKTSLGPAKVYDSGCAAGTIDIYTNW